jgi:hypothetical protein
LPETAPRRALRPLGPWGFPDSAWFRTWTRPWPPWPTCARKATPFPGPDGAIRHPRPRPPWSFPEPPPAVRRPFPGGAGPRRCFRPISESPGRTGPCGPCASWSRA